MGEHRPAAEWLSELQKAKTEGNIGNRPKITISDVLDRANDPNAPESALIPTSPRSVEACLRLGIDPLELQFKPVAFFKRPGEDNELTTMRYDHHEAVRQERLIALQEQRKRLIDEGFSGEGGGGGGGKPGGSKSKAESEATATLIEKERQRLEVLKKRQEREMSQMLEFERQRKELLEKQQRKIAVIEKRAADMLKAKQEHDKEWIKKQREIELEKAKQEAAQEEEARRIARDMHKRELEITAKRAEEERVRRKEAYKAEMDRRKKVEEARRETERILEKQAEEVRKKKIEMDKRDAERLARMKAEQKERQLANTEKRKKADERISAALTQNVEILRKKRDDFERKEKANEERRAVLAEQHRKEEERKAQEQAAKQKELHDKYLLALAKEENRKEEIRTKASKREEHMVEVSTVKKQEHDRTKVERQLYNSLRLDRVDSIQKTKAYQRQLLLEKIMSENEKTRRILSERQQLQLQRKQANMQASLHRHKMIQEMATMRDKASQGKLNNTA